MSACTSIHTARRGGPACSPMHMPIHLPSMPIPMSRHNAHEMQTSSFFFAIIRGCQRTCLHTCLHTWPQTCFKRMVPTQAPALEHPQLAQHRPSAPSGPCCIRSFGQCHGKPVFTMIQKLFTPTVCVIMARSPPRPHGVSAHAYTHADTRAYAHACAHAYDHTCTRACTCVHAHDCAHAYTHGLCTHGLYTWPIHMARVYSGRHDSDEPHSIRPAELYGHNYIGHNYIRQAR